MWKQKPKLDPKIRFQQSSFRKALQSARAYKRTTKPLNQEGFRALLAKLGLTNLWMQIAAPVVLLAIVYLVYVPNLLFLKTIQVTGIEGSDNQQIVALTQTYTKQQPLTAQQNILFLSKSGLQNYLFSHDPTISKITSVKKKFPNKVIITVVPRTSEFFVTTPLEQLLVSNDGLVQQELFGSSTTSTLPNLLSITLNNASSTPSGTHLLEDNFISTLLTIKSLTESQLHLTFDHFEIDHPQSRDITEFVKEGFKIEFNASLDLQQSMDQAQLILNNMQDNQRKTLYYIDMRFEGRGFACLQNTPCVSNQPIVNATSTNASSTTITH